MLNIGMDEAIAKKKNRMKETKEGNLRHMREGKGEGEVWGSKCCTRRTVFVFRIWEDEFPWNLGCSIRNCLFFLWFRRASCEKYSIRDGRKDRNRKKIARWFSSEISFSSNSEERFPYFIGIDFCKIQIKTPSFPLETSIYRQLMQCGIHLQFHITEYNINKIFLFQIF